MLPATGLRTHGWNTALRSIVLLAGFPFLLVLMGYALALLMVAGNAKTIQIGMKQAAMLLPTIVPIALLVAAVWFAIAYFAHNRILDAVTGAKRVADQRDEPRLWHLTEALCISRGMAMPRLAVIETPARNAFASGITRDKAAVTVTRGLMDALDDRELSAVLAHELAHIRNGDARLGVVAAVFVGVITLVTDLVWNSMRFGRFRFSSSSRSSDSRGGGAMVMLALIAIAVAIAVVAHLLALVLRMALSRNREYLADAGAVELTGDADAMIGALRKVEQAPAMKQVPEQVRALFLHDAKLSQSFAAWFATHPPIDARVATLVRYAGGHDPGKLPGLQQADGSMEATDTAASVPWDDQTVRLSPGASGAAPNPWGPATPTPGNPWGPKT